MALDDVRIIRIHGEASTKAKKPQNRQYDYDGAYNPNDLIHGSLLCRSDRKRLKRLKVPSRGILASIARLTAGLCLLGLDLWRVCAGVTSPILQNHRRAHRGGIALFRWNMTWEPNELEMLQQVYKTILREV
jgi:hypothetical protein